MFLGLNKEGTCSPSRNRLKCSGDSKASVCIDLLPDPLVIVDENRRLLRVNKAFEEVTGLGQKELIGKPFSELEILSPENTEILTENLRKRIRGLAVRPYEIGFIDKQGKVRVSEINAKRISYAGRLVDLVLFRDITERKKAEEELQRSEVQLRAQFYGSPDLIMILDRMHRYVRINRTHFLSYNIGKLIGTDALQSLPPDQRELARRKVDKCFMTGKVQEFEHTLRRGEWIRARVVPLQSKGIIDHVMIISTDITETKNLQSKLEEYSRNLEKIIKERTEQLRQTQDKLVKSERFAAIGELAGMVGHDLRNPLTAINNAAYFMRNKLPSCSDETIKDMFKIIDSAILHANKIINDLLEYSREIKLELTECTPKSLLEETLSIIKMPVRVKIVDKTQKEPLFKADKNKLARVFVNLLKNAIDAIPTIGNIKIKSAYTNGNVEISITDTGIGISKETLSKLFSPLVTTKAQGMGFGLAISKRIVEAHQGRITVKSTMGKGTTFRIILPVEPKLEKYAEKTWVEMPESLLLTPTKQNGDCKGNS